jgi:hypothetical protein
MVNVLRRLFWLALLTGAGYAGWVLLSSRRTVASGEPIPSRAVGGAGEPNTVTVAGFVELPEADPALPTADAEIVVADPGVDPAAAWIVPTDGQCPLTHPVKANDKSRIYHVPGGRFYERTGAERCYVTPDAAETDGYRRAKS